MKIEFMNVNFGQKKLQHVSSAGIKEVKMDSMKIEALPAVLAYIEDYAAKNGLDVLNATAEGGGVQIFLVKK